MRYAYARSCEGRKSGAEFTRVHQVSLGCCRDKVAGIPSTCDMLFDSEREAQVPHNKTIEGPAFLIRENLGYAIQEFRPLKPLECCPESLSNQLTRQRPLFRIYSCSFWGDLSFLFSLRRHFCVQGYSPKAGGGSQIDQNPYFPPWLRVPGR